jgi:hypothetical protein
MPLPDKGAPWPPIDPAIRSDMADWSAWYSANPDRLATATSTGTATTAGTGSPRTGRRSTAAVSSAPCPAGSGANRLRSARSAPTSTCRSPATSPAPAPTSCSPNPRSWSRRTRTPGAAGRCWMEDGLRRTLIAQGESTAALGGAYLRIVWDRTISERPWIIVRPRDGAVPTFVHERLRAVTYWTVLGVDGQKVIRHLERHEPGVILHGVYEGTEDNLGKPLDLKAFAETQNYLPAQTLPIGNRLASVYIPNTMTAPDWHDLPGAAGSAPATSRAPRHSLSAIDETYTSWMRDVRLARSRILVPSGYLQSQGPGRGVSWEDREVYAEMNIPPTADHQITLNQFAIRHVEHRETIADLFGRVIHTAGYSGGTFGEDSGGPAVTATEIKARNAGRCPLGRARPRWRRSGSPRSPRPS